MEYLDDPANDEKLKEKKKSLHIYNYLGKADKYIDYEKAQGFFTKLRDVHGFSNVEMHLEEGLKHNIEDDTTCPAIRNFLDKILV